MTENGWPPDTRNFPGVPIPRSQCVDVKIPGTELVLPFQKGIPAIILPAFIAALNQFIEPAYNSRGYADEGSWTPTNSVSTSNHLGGTAFDYNWFDHPFRVADAGWNGSTLINGDQIPAVRELLDFFTYKGIQLVWWGNDWDDPKDPMHFQMGYNTFNNQDICNEFIAKFIRPDGFSRFRENVKPPIPAKGGLTAATLSEAMLASMPMTFYEKMLPFVKNALVQSNCNNIERIAMWIAQIGHESAGLKYMEEIASGDQYDTRTDLGNTPQIDGDGRLYKGRGPIQVTGKSNYRKLSIWAYSKNLVPDDNYFVDNPQELSKPEFGFYGAIWYWTVARPQINGLCDKRDIIGVTRAINGGTNGLEDFNGQPGRRTRWARCLQMGIEKLGVNSLDVIDPTILEELMADDTPWPSGSIFRDNNDKFLTSRQTLANIDAMAYEADILVPSAKRGEQWAIEKIVRLSRGLGPGAFKDEKQTIPDTWAVQHARDILKEVIAANAAAVQYFYDNEGK